MAHHLAGGLAASLARVSLIVAIRSTRRSGQRGNWWRVIRRARSPDTPTVLLEDSSAILGVVIAALGIALALWTGDSRWDAVAGAMIALLLMAISAILTLEMKSLLLGESAIPEVQRSIAAIVKQEPKVKRLIYLRTLHLAPEELLVLAKVELDAQLDANGVVHAIERIESRVYENDPRVIVFHIEPDIYNPGRPQPPWFGKHPEDDGA